MAPELESLEQIAEIEDVEERSDAIRERATKNYLKTKNPEKNIDGDSDNTDTSHENDNIDKDDSDNKDTHQDEDKDKDKSDSDKDTHDKDEDDDEKKKTQQDSSDDDDTSDEDKKKADEDRDLLIKSWQERHDMSPEDAEALYDHAQKQIQRVGDDKNELGKDNYFKQAEISRLQNEIKKMSQPQVGFHADSAIIPNADGTQLVKLTKDQIVEMYKKDYPKTTEDKDSDEVYEMAKQLWETTRKNQYQQFIADMPAKATALRDNIMNGLPESDKKFKDEIKEIIDGVGDMSIVQGFDPKVAIKHVKGARYDLDIKKHGESEYQRGFKKGQEDSKVLGQKTDSAKIKGGNVKGGSGKVSISEDGKQKAHEMFQSRHVTDEEKYAMYNKVMASREKNRQNRKR